MKPKVPPTELPNGTSVIPQIYRPTSFSYIEPSSTPSLIPYMYPPEFSSDHPISITSYDTGKNPSLLTTFHPTFPTSYVTSSVTIFQPSHLTTPDLAAETSPNPFVAATPTYPTPPPINMTWYQHPCRSYHYQ